MNCLRFPGSLLTLICSWFLVLQVYGLEKVRDSSVTVLDDKSFYKALGPEAEWVIAFTASWCGACKSLKPEYDLFASSLKTKKPSIKVINIDVDKSPALSNQFMITRLPTVYHIKNMYVRPMSGIQRDSESLQEYIINEEWKASEPYSGLTAPFSFLPYGIFYIVSFFHGLIEFAKGQPTWVVAGIPLLAILVGIFSIFKTPADNQPPPSAASKKKK